METWVKVAIRLLPRVCRAAMAATATRAAMRPYSIAVAPFSSLRNDLIMVMFPVFSKVCCEVFALFGGYLSSIVSKFSQTKQFQIHDIYYEKTMDV